MYLKYIKTLFKVKLTKNYKGRGSGGGQGVWGVTREEKRIGDKEGRRRRGRREEHKTCRWNRGQGA